MTETMNPAAVPEELQKPLDRLAELGGAVRRIDELISQAQLERAEAEDDHKTTLRAVSENEAAAVLDGAGSDRKLRTALQKHAEAQQLIEARLDGLRLRRADALTRFDDAVEALMVAGLAWKNTQLGKAREMFEAAQRRFLNEVTEPCAIGRAFGDSTFARIARHTHLERLNDNRNGFVEISNFRENLAMLPIIETFSQLFNLITGTAEDARRFSARKIVEQDRVAEVPAAPALCPL